MSKRSENKLSDKEYDELIKNLEGRFQQNLGWHKNINWKDLMSKLDANPDKLFSLHKMEKTGGEPDVVEFNKGTDEYLFFDCSPESPAGRRSLCYDRIALESRKKNKPENNAVDMAKTMGIQLLSEDQYRKLQTLGDFDMKTSSWIITPSSVRKRGGALFADFRYGQTFVYHNGAESYYAARGFRGCLKI